MSTFRPERRPRGHFRRHAGRREAAEFGAALARHYAAKAVLELMQPVQVPNLHDALEHFWGQMVAAYQVQLPEPREEDAG